MAARGGTPSLLLPALALGGAAMLRVVSNRGGPLRLASLLVRRRRPRGTEESRLYARRRRRLEAHLGRLPNGRRVVLAVPVDGSGRAAVYRVDERRPWHDFERQAHLVGCAWGPCRSVNAGL